MIRQLLSSGQWSFFPQLHPFCGVVVVLLLTRIFLLWTAHVGHAAVAYFHVVIVKDGAEIVFRWEVFLDDVEENLATLDCTLFLYGCCRRLLSRCYC